MVRATFRIREKFTFEIEKVKLSFGNIYPTKIKSQQDYCVILLTFLYIVRLIIWYCIDYNCISPITHRTKL